MAQTLLPIVVLGFLAAVFAPRFSGRTEAAKPSAAMTQISTFKTALDGFEADNGFYPNWKNGLMDLIQAPSNAPNWRGPYLQADRIPLDPWDNPYIYVCPGRHNRKGFDLWSAGPDGRFGTEDDIVNWTTPTLPP